MKLQIAWLLLVSFSLVGGILGCGERNAGTDDAAQEAARQVAMEEAGHRAAKEGVAARKEQEECSQRLSLPIEITNSIDMRFVLIPAGEFTMGSPKSDDLAWIQEAPPHAVRITKPFYLGVYEVTQAEYENVTGENPSRFAGANNPVDRVSWDDAVTFCRLLSGREGKRYRLPTEAEWEYACRAGTTTRYSFGADPASLGEYAWFEGVSTTQPVGGKKPNAWGLYDMYGNLFEFCSDWYEKHYYAKSPSSDPLGPESGSERVSRGSSWSGGAPSCRSAYRGSQHPGITLEYWGFRVAHSPSSE